MTEPKLPAEVKLGPFTYRVKPSESMELYGSTDNRRGKIKVATWQSDEQLRATVLHETLHAAMWAAGANKLLDLDFEAEERTVRLLEPWLLGLLRDNPDLVAFLLAP